MPARCYAVVDRDGDHKAERVVVIASGLEQPNGVAMRNGALYVATASQILRFDDIEKHLDAPPAPVTVRDNLPESEPGAHVEVHRLRPGRHAVHVGRLDVQRLRCRAAMTAAILRMKPDGSGLEVFAEGVRNSVGFDWHPVTHELWFTDNGRDMLGDDVPNDELNVASKAGLHFGFPYCHQGDVPDPEFGAQRACSTTEPPVQKLGAHVAAIGFTFYTGDMFPAQLQERGDHRPARVVEPIDAERLSRHGGVHGRTPRDGLRAVPRRLPAWSGICARRTRCGRAAPAAARPTCCRCRTDRS